MKTVAQTAFLMTILTLISKLIGFSREMVMANYFGTSYITDAYVMATAIPSVIFGGILVSVSTAYMPTFSKIVENQGIDKGNKFTSEIINLVFLISLLSGIVGLIFSDQIVALFASGFEGETAELTSFFVKITFAYVIFSSMSGILDAYLQYKGSFLPPIITGYLLSICSIVFIIICAHTSYYYLPFGMLLGYFLRFVFIVTVSKKNKFSYVPSFSYNNVVKQIVALMIPVFIGSSLIKINSFINKALATGLGEGSVSALNYANLLNNMIITVTVSILTTIVYPKLVQSNSLQEYERFNKILDMGFYIIILVALPFSLGTMTYSNQIVQIVYERGAFDETATILTGSALLYYASGLVFISLNALFTKTYYSMHNMITPMIYAGISVLINVVLSLVLINSMEINGLALATSFSTMCNTMLLYFGMKKQYPMVRILRSKKKLWKLVIAATVAVGSSLIVYKLTLGLVHNTIMGYIQLFIAVIFSAVVYYIMLFVFKIEELKILKQLFKK